MHSQLELTTPNTFINISLNYDWKVHKHMVLKVLNEEFKVPTCWAFLPVGYEVVTEEISRFSWWVTSYCLASNCHLFQNIPISMTSGGTSIIFWINTTVFFQSSYNPECNSNSIFPVKLVLSPGDLLVFPSLVSERPDALWWVDL